MVLHAKNPIHLLAVGSGGVDELADAIDAKIVSWALMRIEVGSGTFMRKKMIFLTSNSSATPSVTKARQLMRTAEVKAYMGTVHAQIELSNIANFTAENILTQVSSIFASDSVKNMRITASQLLEEYNRSLVKGRVQRRFKRLRCKVRALQAFQSTIATPKEAWRQAASGVPPTELKTDVLVNEDGTTCLVEELDEEEGQKEEEEQEQAIEEEAVAVTREPSLITFEDAVRQVADANGRYNWLVLEPERFNLHNAGCAGFEEMRECLRMDKVLFGLLRLSFGKEPHKITKWVFLHWTGPETPTVKRGRWIGRSVEAQEKLRRYVTLNHHHKANDNDDLNLSCIIDAVKRLTYDAKDNLEYSPTARKSWKGLEEYMSSVNDHMARVVSESLGPKSTETGKDGELPRDSSESSSSTANQEEEVGPLLSFHQGEALPEEEMAKAEVQEDPPSEPVLPTLEYAVNMVQASGGQWNWVLVTCGTGACKTSRSSLRTSQE